MATHARASDASPRSSAPSSTSSSPDGNLPAIFNALQVTNPAINDEPGEPRASRSRSTSARTRSAAIAMDSTDGLVRGMEVQRHRRRRSRCRSASRALGRIINVDRRAGRRDGPDHRRRSATRSTARRPTFTEQATQVEMFETGIKVVDLLAPYQRGGKIGLFGGAGVGKTVLIHGAHQQRRQAARRRARCSPASASARARATTSTTR